MRGFLANARYASQFERPLAVRGGAMRTFVGLAAFLTLGLLCLGVYLIRDQFAQTPAPQSFGLFTAAFILATAMSLLYELIQVPRSIWRSAAGVRMALVPRSVRAVSVARRAAHPRHGARHEHRYEQRIDLPYHRSYVDRVRVRA